MRFWGNEDTDLIAVGSASVDQNAVRFDSDVDSGLAVPPPLYPAPLASFWRSIGDFAPGAGFSLSVRVWSNATGNITTASKEQAFLLRLLDSDGAPNLAITAQHDGDTGNSNLSGPWIVQTISIAGVYTPLGATGGFVGPPPSLPITIRTSANTPSGDTLPFASTVGVQVGAIVTGTNIPGGTTVLSFVEDVSVTLSANVSGDVPFATAISFLSNQISTLTITTNDGLQVFLNDALMFSSGGFTGIVAGFDLGEPVLPALTLTGTTVWSKIIVNDTATQSLNMIKMTITGAGATSDWNGDSNGDTVNEVVLNVTDGIDSAVPNQIELFTQSFTFPSGSWSIVGIGLNAYASRSPFPIVLSTNADTPSGAVLPFTSTAGVADGQAVSGLNIPSDTVVLSFVSNTSVTLTNAITGDVPSDTPISFFLPQNIDLVLRISGTDYLAADPVTGEIQPSLARQAYFWEVSPATGMAFTEAEVAGLQIGAKSLI